MNGAFAYSAARVAGSSTNITGQIRRLHTAIESMTAAAPVRMTCGLYPLGFGHARIFLNVHQPGATRQFMIAIGPFDQQGGCGHWTEDPDSIPIRCVGDIPGQSIELKMPFDVTTNQQALSTVLQAIVDHANQSLEKPLMVSTPAVA